MKLHFLLVVCVLASLGCAASATKKASPPAPVELAGEAKGENEKADAQPAQRKIIYTAQIELVVEEFDPAQKALLGLVEQNKGYVARSEVRGAPGARRTGTWTVRVPEAHFMAFLAALDKLGELERNAIDSKDVTEEFYDLEARIKNKKVEEERLIKHLKDSTGKLEDILAVERELSRVRGEIEQAQGRLQKLSNLTELTTVTITIHERKGYVPPAAPSFGTSISRTFEGSWEGVITLGKYLVLTAVALAPWLPLVAVVGLSIWLPLRRRRPPVPRRGSPPQEPPPPVRPA